MQTPRSVSATSEKFRAPLTIRRSKNAPAADPDTRRDVASRSVSGPAHGSIPEVDDHERRRLVRVLDALDDLFDGKISVWQVQEAIESAATALDASEGSWVRCFGTRRPALRKSGSRAWLLCSDRTHSTCCSRCESA
jgi:hypothetical protein